jgi:hypothetical protein
MAVVAPRAPQALAIGEKACGAIMHFIACSSGRNIRFAVRPSAASVA